MTHKQHEKLQIHMSAEYEQKTTLYCNG